MGIVSISLPGNTEEELAQVIENGGFKGKSDAVREALSYMLREQRQQKAMRGLVTGVLLVVHDEKYESAFSDARHNFESIIKTLLHNQLGKGKCLEIFIVEGQAEQIKKLIHECRKTRRAEYIKLITA